MPNRIASDERDIPRATRTNHLRRALLTTLAFGAVGLLLASGSVPCTFAQLTHLPCPGCGSTRAVRGLLAGDPHALVHYNPFGPVMAALLGALAVNTIVVVYRGGRASDAGSTRAGVFLTRAFGVVIVLDILLWIARFFGALGGPVPV